MPFRKWGRVSNLLAAVTLLTLAWTFYFAYHAGNDKKELYNALAALVACVAGFLISLVLDKRKEEAATQEARNNHHIRHNFAVALQQAIQLPDTAVLLPADQLDACNRLLTQALNTPAILDGILPEPISTPIWVARVLRPKDPLPLSLFVARIFAADPALARLPDPAAHQFASTILPLFHDRYKAEVSRGGPGAVTEIVKGLDDIRQGLQQLRHDSPAPTPTPTLLTGPTDHRIQPMRGFFTGRAPDLAKITSFLAGQDRFAVVTGQLYSVEGGPGIGKTEICKAALRAHLAATPACRILYADLTGVRNADTLRATLARLLGDEKLAESPHRLLDTLHHAADILYLDNLEDALPERDDSAAAVFLWLEQIVMGPVRVLASSRRKLDSIALDLPLGRLQLDEAVATFNHFWNAATSGNAVGQPLDPVRDLAPGSDFRAFLDKDLDCHALSMRLLGSQRTEWGTWRELRKQWQLRRTHLAFDPRNPLAKTDRRHSLDISISLTFSQVEANPDATRLWIASACFPDGMGQAALQALVPDPDNRHNAVSLLRRLSVADGGLAGNQNPSLAFMAALRQFAAGLDTAQTLPVWRDCLSYFAELARWVRSTELGATAAERGNALDTFARDFGNLRETLLEVTRPTAPEAALISLVEGICTSLHYTWQFHTLASVDVLRHLEAAFARTGRAHSRANTLKALGDLERRLGQVDSARLRYNEALPLYVAEQANLGRANTLLALGELERRLGQVDSARLRYNEALPLFVAVQDNIGRANTLKALGDLESRLGQVDSARLRYNEALPLFVAVQDNIGRANTLQALGDLERRLGQVDSARLRYNEALPLYVAEQDNLGRANTLQALGDLEIDVEDFAAARRCYDIAVPLYRSERELIGLAQALATVALLQWTAGDRAAARNSAAQAREAARNSNTPPVVDWVENYLARAEQKFEVGQP